MLKYKFIIHYMRPWDVNWTATNGIKNKTRNHTDSSVIANLPLGEVFGEWLINTTQQTGRGHLTQFFPAVGLATSRKCFVTIIDRIVVTTAKQRVELTGKNSEVLIVIQILVYELVS